MKEYHDTVTVPIEEAESMLAMLRMLEEEQANKQLAASSVDGKQTIHYWSTEDDRPDGRTPAHAMLRDDVGTRPNDGRVGLRSAPKLQMRTR